MGFLYFIVALLSIGAIVFLVLCVYIIVNSIKIMKMQKEIKEKQQTIVNDFDSGVEHETDDNLEYDNVDSSTSQKTGQR